MDDLETFLQELASHLTDSETGTAPRFNVFRSLRLKETTATAILKDLLDPKGSHGQETAFLRDFLERLRLPFELPGNLENAQLHTEDRTDKNRRMDLTLRLGSRIVALENKIGAGQQQDQVGDYIKFLEKEYKGRWFFIFLTPDGLKPIESCPEWNCHEAANRARCLSYVELSGWITSWVKLCEADRVKPFLADLAIWAKKPSGDHMCSDSTRNEVLNLSLKDDKYFRTLTTVLSCFDGNGGKLFSDFADTLKLGLQKEFPATDGWMVACSIQQKDPTIYLSRPGVWESGAEIKIAATPLNDDFAFGVFWLKADYYHKSKIQERLDREFGEGEKDKNWPWYQNFPPLGDIEVHRWLEWDMFHASQTRTADLVAHITDLLVRVNNAVGEILSKD